MSEREIFEGALEHHDPARRRAYLDRACGADAALRARVEALLRSHESGSEFLNVPALEQLGTPPADGPTRTIDAARADGPGARATGDGAGDGPTAPDLSFLARPLKPGGVGTLGHYEIQRLLGQGAFGLVFRAFDERLHRLVAIKVLSPQLAATSPPRKRFLREARSAAAVKHENVVQVYAVEEQPLPYLVMEFVDGQTLKDRMDGTGPLELPEVLHLGRQMAAGLAAAHERGLIHRDIKPANILIESGSEQKVKITDFGLARAADDASMTRSGVISGTPMYMAPEQAQGLPLDHRADLFSLGSVLYQMASGRPPFRAATTAAVLRRVAEEDPRPIREIQPSVPDWLCAIIAKLHAKNPGERFQSARELADLLAHCEAALRNHGRVELPADLSLPRSKPGGPKAAATPRRRRRAVALVGVLALLVAAGLAEATGLTNVGGAVQRLFAPEAAQARREEPGPAEPPPVTAPEPPKPADAAPADALRREHIPRAVLATLGGGDPARSPADLVAVFGEGRFRVNRGPRAPAFSPDDTTLAVGADNEVHLFDSATGERRAVFGPFGLVLATCFSPDGTTLAVGDERAARLVDVRTGRVIHDLAPPAPGMVTQLYFTPDGKSLVTGSHHSSGGAVWDVAKGSLVRTLPALLYGGGRGPDGRPVVLARAADGERIDFYSPETGQLVFAGPKWPRLRWPEEITGAALSADGKRLALGKPDRVAVWDVAALNADPDAPPLLDKKAPGGWVQFDRASGRLWAAEYRMQPGEECRARCWDPVTGTEVAAVVMRHGEGEVWHALSHDGRTLYLSPRDRFQLGLYDTRTGTPRVAPRGHTGMVYALAFSPDGRRLASGGNDLTVRIWDVATGAERRVLPWDGRQIRQVVFSPDGRRLAVRDYGGTVALWRTEEGTRVWYAHTGDGSWQGVRFSPDGQVLAVATRTGGVKFLRAATGEERGAWQTVHDAEARGVAFSPDGKQVAVSGSDGSVVVVDAGTGATVRKWNPGKGAVDGLEFTRDGAKVIFGSHEPEPAVGLLDPKTDEAEVIRVPRSVHHLAVSGRVLATCGGDYAVRLWDLADPDRRSVVLATAPDEGPHRVAFSLDGRHLATGNIDGTIHVYRLNRSGEDVRDWMAARRGPPPGLPEGEWLKRVASLAPGNLFDAVGDRFRELNPGAVTAFGGGEVRGGHVRTVWVRGPKVTDFSALRALPDLRSADLFDTSLADRDLAHLKGATGLRSFHGGQFFGTKALTDGAAEDLRGMKELEELGLWGSQLTDDGLERLTSLRQLKKLNLGRTKVTDAGAVSLAKFPELTDLVLSEGALTDDGLKNMGELKHLWRLDMGATRVRGPGLEHLKRWPRLRELTLSATAVGDDALQHLAEYPALQWLALRNCPVTDDGLGHLKRIKRLKWVALPGTKVTAEGVKKFAAELPNCHIESDHGVFPPGRK